MLSKGIPPGSQQYSDEELGVAVEEANRWGRFVAAHAHGADGIKAAIRAGVRTIDHGSMMDDEAIEMLKSRQGKVYYVPTLYVGEVIDKEGEQFNVPQSEIERSRKMKELRPATFRKALKAGLQIPFSRTQAYFHMDITLVNLQFVSVKANQQ